MIKPADHSPEPLSTADLYGLPKTDPSKPKPHEPLVYEETPIIEPIREEPAKSASAQPLHQPIPEKSELSPETPLEVISDGDRQMEMPKIKPGYQAKPGPKFSQIIGNLWLYGLCFVLGIGVTIVWRMFGGGQITLNPKSAVIGTIKSTIMPTEIPVSSGSAVISPTIVTSISSTVKIKPTPTIIQATPIIISSGTVSGWQTITLGAQVSFQVPESSLQLPSDFKPLACDPPGCNSQGTEMSGETRFTVSFRQFTKPVENFEKSKITDAAGRVFPNTGVASVSGKTAIIFSGEFNGTTTGGYGFSQMRGVMILVDPKITLEINHFTPRGVEADFAADDKIFDQILKTVKID